MDSRDSAFIRDFFHFTARNHLVTAKALHNGLEHLMDVAVEVEHSLNPEKDRKDNLREVEENNEAMRTQRVLIAKIYAEQVGLLEDLGAFGAAIRGRRGKGIFKHYFEGPVSDVANFYDMLLKVENENPISTLDILLNLPSLASLKGKLSMQELDAITADYENFASHLYSVAHSYRDDFQTIGSSELNGIITDDWKNDINIIVHVGNKPSAKAVLTTAYNKIKHRFMLTDLLPEYVSSDVVGTERLYYCRLGQEPAIVDAIMDKITIITKSVLELAGIIMILAEAGVDL